MRCVNVDGSYSCECFDGFERNDNDTLCIGKIQIDISATLFHYVLQHTPVKLSIAITSTDVFHVDVDECATNNGGCGQGCAISDGSGSGLDNDQEPCNGRA